MRILAALTLIAFTSCGPEVDVTDTHSVPIARYREGLAMSSAGGCSTSIASGLRDQLVEELNCIQPNLMVNFTGSHTNLHSGVNPWLAAGASSALKSATNAKNDFITISSAYRTVAEQYLLYRWQGSCGIQVAAAPGASNHQSGRAIDTPNYSYWRTALTNAGWTWLGSSDVVHFDHFASPNNASKSVLAFQRLWNKNNANKLVEDGIWGPASNSAMASSPTSGFPNHGCAPVTPTTGKITGTITDTEGGAALAGVTVTAGGQTKTTAANGTFEFTLGAGTHTVSASLAGYTSNSVSRAISLGGSVSASMTLTRIVTEGTIRGVVRNADASPLEGVLVTAGSQMRTTGADGTFAFTLGAGTIQLSASKPAFVTVTQSVALTAGATLDVNFTLLPSGEDLAPVVKILSPANELSSDLADVVLVGTVTDDFTNPREVKLVHNGGELTVQVVNGRFEAPLRLDAGVNDISVSYTDASNQLGTASWVGRFRAGFDGLVHRYDDMNAIVVDAQLTLFDVEAGARIGEVRSGVDGRFSLVASRSGFARLVIEKDGMTTREILVTVSPAERTSLDLGLTTGDAPAIRIIEPEFDSTVDAEEVRISGVVSGLEVAGVTVNGVQATLIGSGFVATVPLPQGRTTFEIVAENGLGMSVRREHIVRRPMEDARGGCSSMPGGVLLVLGALLARRRRVRGHAPQPAGGLHHRLP
ncbi:MAG: carboxypeptidase regulatory-like domain-containing protein [Archangium sp.]